MPKSGLPLIYKRFRKIFLPEFRKDFDKFFVEKQPFSRTSHLKGLKRENVIYQDFALANRLQIVDNGPGSPLGPFIQEPTVMSQPKEKISCRAELPGEVPLPDLIRLAQGGDTGAMEAIYAHLKTPLFNLAFRYTFNRAAAEDLLQEIFLKVFSHLEDVQNMDTFVPWAYRIALNTCFSYLRLKKAELQKTVSLTDVEGTLQDVDRDVSPENDIRKPLDKAIGTLPHKLREIFLLHDVQGFKHEEIARMLGLSVGTSKSQLFKARLKLRGYLRDRRVI
jgi:RNA polymerase sigma-70 factor (ECF subfamily)